MKHWALMRMSLGLIGLFVAIALTNGCALTVDRVNLNYVPRGSITVRGAEEVSVRIEVSDQRGISKVSAIKNGCGMECVDIVSIRDVTDVVS